MAIFCLYLYKEIDRVIIMASFFSKLKETATDFKNYMKKHPVKGGIFIALAVVGVAVIVTASVFSGGAAAVAVGGGMAAAFGGMGATGAIAFGAVTAVASAAALTYDVQRSTTKAQATEELHERLNKKTPGATVITAHLPTASTTTTSEESKNWHKGTIPPSDHFLRNNKDMISGESAEKTHRAKNSVTEIKSESKKASKPADDANERGVSLKSPGVT